MLAGCVKLSYLSAAELPTPLPTWMARADVAVAVGVGLGAALLAAWHVVSTFSSGRPTRHPTAERAGHTIS
jgi:hypothetical protein